MTHQDQIEKHGYCVFKLTTNNDADSTTPISAKYQAIILCSEGEATFDVNMRPVKLNKGDCLFCNNLLYKKTLEMSYGFSAQVLVFDKSLIFDFAVGIPTGHIELMYSMPVVHIEDPVDWELISNQFNTLDLLQNKHLELKHNEVVNSAFRSLFILMAGLRGGSDSQNLTFSHGDVYFRNFVELIDDNVKQQHEVAYYANKLNITAKYLSEVCKSKSGYKAKEMISFVLISKIKQEMMMSGKSIKNIAYEYGFADQSSMGKFFSKMTGKSPSDFKKTREVKKLK
jgi:AraC-like DNA-binding protein